MSLLIFHDLLDSFRYIQTLRDDAALRASMGKRGRDAVSKQSISHVVADLLKWYELGKTRRKARHYIRSFSVAVALLVTIPFAIISLGCYDTLVRCFTKNILGFLFDLP